MGNSNDQLILVHIESFQSMLLVFYTPLMQFSIFSKNAMYPLQKINMPHNTNPVWNHNFLTHHKIYYWNFSLPTPHFGRRGACHDITRSADSQINIKSSNNDRVTVEFYKNVHQKTYLPNKFRLWIFGNKIV